MNSSSVRYGVRLGCRFGTAHQFELIKDTPGAKMENCIICGLRKRWVKGNKGRINNVEYLRMHVREFAQPTGSTKRVFMKLNHPEKCIIII